MTEVNGAQRPSPCQARISEYSPDSDRESIRSLYSRYLSELRSIEPSYPGPKDESVYWWESAENVTVLYLIKEDRPAGFVIVTREQWVDPDVDSEICEMFIEKPSRNLASLRRLIEVAMTRLTGKAGFQVLVKNVRAREVFQEILRRELIPYTYHHAVEDGLQYARYRFDAPRPPRS